MYGSEADGRRPISRGSKHNLENGNIYGGGGYQAHQEHHHEDFVQDDEDEDMW